MDISFSNKEYKELANTKYEELSKKLKKKYSKQIVKKFHYFCNTATNLSFDYLKKINGLNIEKLQGYENRWSARLDKKYRVEFEYYADKDLIKIVKILLHYE